MSSPGHGASSAVQVAEQFLSAGRSSEKLSLSTLQSKMKCDPEGYVSQLLRLCDQFNSSLVLFEQQAAMNFASITGIGGDPTVAKDLGDKAMFLAHVTPFYPKHLKDFPQKLASLIRCASRNLPSGLRCRLAQALILLVNRKIVDIGETLSLFMELQTLGDRTLKKLAFDHVIHSIKRMNQKHKNQAKNRALQNVLFSMLQEEDEVRAKRALVTLCELHRRKDWFDERTANAICGACFHPAPRIMKAALSFLLDYEKIENDSDSDNSDSEDETKESPQVILSKETIYKAHHQGTAASKKKKKAKLERAMRSIKRKQRLSTERNNNSYYSPLNHLQDAQGFAEKLLSRLHKCNEKFEVKLMLMKLIARTVGLHRLILLDFYRFLQKYIQPRQQDITNLLAAVVQACHDMVPPNEVEPLFYQIVNEFIHDRSRPEAMTVGLNAVREICMRMPLLMNEDLLRDLALHKKSHEKGVSIAARSLIGLFREVNPLLLVKKDRGRPMDAKARPKSYGEVSAATDVPGAEFLPIVHNEDDQEGSDSDDSVGSGFDNDQENDLMTINDDDEISSDTKTGESDEEDDLEDMEDDLEDMEDDLEDSEQDDEEDGEVSEQEDDDVHTSCDDESVGANSRKKDSAKKRKIADFDDQLLAADTSLRALKKLAGTTMGHAPLPESTDGILSNEDFKRIKELKEKHEARNTFAQHGLARSAIIKVPDSDRLSLKRVDGATLEVHVKKRQSKEEKLALIKAGREDRGTYHSKTAVKQKKTGGLSNRQKEHKKKMPVAAKRSKIAKSRVEKKKKNQRAGKQFRGRKAWK
ncbi:protein SDA1 homolog [Arachis ipaensis]|nr:protein SDA1 homolog [Arachis ipaensis]